MTSLRTSHASPHGSRSRIADRSQRSRCGALGTFACAAALGACSPDLDELRGPGIDIGGSGGGDMGGSGGCGGSSCAPGPGTAGSGGSGGSSGSGGSGGSGGTTSDGGSAGATSAAPQLRYDFEQDNLAFQGWAAVGPQRPVGVQDAVERTSEAAHSGQYSIRMVYNGSYPDAGAPPADPFWGIQRSGGPPSDAEVTFWMMTTAPDVSIEVFAQTGNTFTWNVLTNTVLPPNEWRELDVFIPPASAGALSNWGIKVYAPFDIEGYIYLDEVSW